MDEPGFSNGYDYGDLDRDGDLDLVVNNVNMEPFIYRNRTTGLNPELLREGIEDFVYLSMLEDCSL